MIDKANPEIQAYLQEELQRQTAQIAERILWRNVNSVISNPTYEEMEYYTGLSRKKIEEIAEKCRYKLMIREECAEGFLLGEIESFCDCLKEENSDFEEIARTYDITSECVREWAKNPNKHAVLELVAQGIEDRYIRQALHLTCPAAHCGRRKPHGIFSRFAYPIVPCRDLPHFFPGLAARCHSLV